MLHRSSAAVDFAVGRVDSQVTWTNLTSLIQVTSVRYSLFLDTEINVPPIESKLITSFGYFFWTKITLQINIFIGTIDQIKEKCRFYETLLNNCK